MTKRPSVAQKLMGAQGKRSLNVPIAAFVMTVFFTGYCIRSLRAARHEAKYNSTSIYAGSGRGGTR
ncbi:hypothetical protein FQN57_006685 [Myotisia sp. PD_48]|nr:hypothetical protein FQN57_006685 [Myotisia sp. PD_48]